MMNMIPLKSYLPFTHVRFGGSSWCNQDHLLTRLWVSYGSILKLGHQALASSRNSPSSVGNPWCVPLPSSRKSCFTQFDHVSHHIMFLKNMWKYVKIQSSSSRMFESWQRPLWQLEKKNHRLRLRSELFELWRTLGTGGSWPHGPWCVFRRGALECCSWVVFKRSGLENVEKCWYHVWYHVWNHDISTTSIPTYYWW